MDIYKELEPMIWAFISGVEENKIRRQRMTEEEEKRVLYAIDIAEKTNIFLEDEENYDLRFLWYMAEKYKNEHNIDMMVIDYLELNGALISEYAQLTRGMAVREDQVLLSLSANVKNIARKFDLFMLGLTQTTDEARRDGVRDQRAVKGARSLPNKVDLGITTFEPTKKEMEIIETLMENGIGLRERLIPNICYNIYKNRGGELKKIKIWAYQNLGNMRFVDLFCTDDNYNLINVDKVSVQLMNETKDKLNEVNINVQEKDISEFLGDEIIQNNKNKLNIDY